VRVTVYTKPACPLCDHLLEDLAWLQTQIGFSVELHDISTDPVAEERFRYFVPVLEVGGALYYPPHDALTLYNTLAAAIRRPHDEP
jgi:glutaredoxin